MLDGTATDGAPRPVFSSDARLLSDIERLPRWVARFGKQPRCSNTPGRPAQTNDPATWGTRAEAQAAAAQLGEEGGVGLVLGDLGDGWWLAGLDLDHCVGEDGLIEEWAWGVLTALGGLQEMSPSGRGLHIYIALTPRELDQVRNALRRTFGSDELQKREWRVGERSIELHFRNYLTFTDDRGERLLQPLRPQRGEPAALRPSNILRLVELIERDGPAIKRAWDAAESETNPGEGPEDERQAARGMIAAAIQRAEDAAPGTRNDVLNKAATTIGGLLVAAGMGEDEAVERLMRARDVSGEPGDRAKDRDTIRRALRDGAKRPIQPHQKRGAGQKPPLLAAVELLRKEADWQGAFALDEFAQRIVVRRPLPGAPPGDRMPRPLVDLDRTTVALWLQQNKVKAGPDVAGDAINAVAAENRYHSVRDYLAGLRWDGVERLDRWLIEHLGAEDTSLNREFGRRWMIGAAARIGRPGCLMKTVLCIEGDQDIGKSSALRALAVRDEWFLDHMPDLASKDAPLAAAGKWIVEFAEFDALSRSAASRAKAFLSTQVDTYRAPYARVAEDRLREWVAAATINPGAQNYLRDESGNVRFWTVAVGVGWPKGQRVDITGLRAARDQLWAEAHHRFLSDEPWWIDNAVLRAAQAEAAAERLETDPRESLVAEYLEERRQKPGWATMPGILADVIGLERSASNYRAEAINLGRVVMALGWVKHKLRTGPEGGGHYYFPPEAARDPLGYARRIFAVVEARAKGVAAQIPGLDGEDPL